MEQYCAVEFVPGTREELLPDFDSAFPHILNRTGFREGESAPWHWHQAVELVYVESGVLEYVTPSGSRMVPAGAGAFVNSNVLHMTRGCHTPGNRIHSIHLFDPSLISGGTGSRMEEKYVLPLTTALQAELILLDPEESAHGNALELLRCSLELDPAQRGYELRMRAILSEIWLEILEIARPLLEQPGRINFQSEQIKGMLLYVHSHYGEKLTVKDVAKAACISERACFDLFRKHLRTTPMEYINSFRLRCACSLLTQTGDSVTEISAACGMNNSYFCQMFRESTGFTPMEYRRFYRRHQSSLNTIQR